MDNGPPDSHARIAWVGLVLLGAATVVALIVFDLGPALAFDDDWGFSWSVRQTVGGHLRIFPASSALALPQILLAAAVSFGHPDQRLLRLASALFLPLTLWSLFRLSRLAGADRFWSAVACLALAVCPAFLANATSFMTDGPYLALCLGSAVGVLWWATARRGQWVCLLLMPLAAVQRQLGVVLPLAVTCCLLAESRFGRRLVRVDVVWLVVVWVAVAVASAIPIVTHLTPPTQGNRLDAILETNVLYKVVTILLLPSELGLYALPFGVALLIAGRRSSPIPAPRWFIPLVVVIVALGEIWFLAHPAGGLTIRGPMPINLSPGHKPPVYPLPLFALYVLGAIVVGIWLLLARRKDWRPSQLGVEGRTLVILALSQFLPVLGVTGLPFNRYYFPMVALLLPLAARLASQAPRTVPAVGFALGACALSLSFYVVGEQDYEAWMQARDEAARMAYRVAPPQTVDAGYEANAVYWEIPHYAATGIDVSSLADPNRYDYSISGPKHPQLVLDFAPTSDPHLGVTYWSLAPARIIVLPSAADRNRP